MEQENQSLINQHLWHNRVHCVEVKRFVCVRTSERVLEAKQDEHVNKTKPITRPSSNQCLVAKIDCDIDDDSSSSSRDDKYDKVFLVLNTHYTHQEKCWHIEVEGKTK